ncbi:hypothetical protein JDS87_07675 [Bacillus cereus]|nr:hypothetical protein [Bacillus cereus]
MEEERQISASLVTIIGYIEKEVKPHCYEEHIESAKKRKKRKENTARLLRKLERRGINPEDMYGGVGEK